MHEVRIVGLYLNLLCRPIGVSMIALQVSIALFNSFGASIRFFMQSHCIDAEETSVSMRRECASA